ncbi:MAG: hypothetical protein K5989_02460 [Lachnospiraceae bacterium]|nr:hypothetical protein [Lachnospiraceae bacterium]
MGGYKVSYKVLSQQGDALKAMAKGIDSYITELEQIKGALGSDSMLQDARAGLAKVAGQFEGLRTAMSLAGEALAEGIGKYTNTEQKNIKRSGETKAHKRDFYKQPVTIASAGGGAAVAGAVGSGAASAASYSTATETSTTINYQDNSTNSVEINNYGAGGDTSAADMSYSGSDYSAPSSEGFESSGLGATASAEPASISAGAVSFAATAAATVGIAGGFVGGVAAKRAAGEQDETAAEDVYQNPGQQAEFVDRVTDVDVEIIDP